MTTQGGDRGGGSGRFIVYNPRALHRRSLVHADAPPNAIIRVYYSFPGFLGSILAKTVLNDRQTQTAITLQYIRSRKALFIKYQVC